VQRGEDGEKGRGSDGLIGEGRGDTNTKGEKKAVGDEIEEEKRKGGVMR